MALIVEEHVPTVPVPVPVPICAADGMPLFPTIVGLRCPLCGAQAMR